MDLWSFLEAMIQASGAIQRDIIISYLIFDLLILFIHGSVYDNNKCATGTETHWISALGGKIPLRKEGSLWRMIAIIPAGCCNL